MEFEEALEEFGKALGKLKIAYAEKYCANPSYIQVLVDAENNVSIIPTIETGEYIYCFRDWVDTDIE